MQQRPDQEPPVEAALQRHRVQRRRAAIRPPAPGVGRQEQRHREQRSPEPRAQMAGTARRPRFRHHRRRRSAGVGAGDEAGSFRSLDFGGAQALPLGDVHARMLTSRARVHRHHCTRRRSLPSVLWEARFWPLIADGSVTVTFRRWKRPQVVAGRRYRTPGGIIEADDVSFVAPETITTRDARRAGYATPDDVRADLRGDMALPVTRIAFHLVEEPDPRSELASTSALTAEDVADIDRRLDRLDAHSPHGAWTRATLDAIAEHPATRAAALAAAFGRDTAPFKLDVRKLKNLGLTISLERGYELSPRGSAYRRARRTRSST